MCRLPPVSFYRQKHVGSPDKIGTNGTHAGTRKITQTNGSSIRITTHTTTINHLLVPDPPRTHTRTTARRADGTPEPLPGADPTPTHTHDRARRGPIFTYAGAAKGKGGKGAKGIAPAKGKGAKGAAGQGSKGLERQRRDRHVMCGMRQGERAHERVHVSPMRPPQRMRGRLPGFERGPIQVVGVHVERHVPFLCLLG